jgi:phosphatidylserine decarboxylase
MKFTRHGFWEMLIGTVVLVGLAAALGFGLAWWLAGLVCLPVLVWLFAFFRDPERPLAAHAGDRVTYVSPADGTVSDVMEFDEDPVIHEATVRVGIFLSVFNVHVNRSPCDGRVRQVVYKKGKFLNALDHSKASEHNESNTIILEDEQGDPVAVVKQIVGLIARRIVCTKEEGDPVTRGERIGMIKFGSRTELTIPKRLAPKILVEPGQKVRGGADAIASVELAHDAPARTPHDPEMEPILPATPT